MFIDPALSSTSFGHELRFRAKGPVVHGDSERAPRREGSREGTSRVSAGGGAELVVLRAGPVGRTALPRDGGLDSAA